MQAVSGIPLAAVHTAPIEDYAETLGFETPEQSALFLAVMELPQKYRVPIHLYYYEDYSVREIAAALGLRESAVQTRLLRARQKLKHKLEGWNDDGIESYIRQPLHICTPPAARSDRRPNT